MIGESDCIVITRLAQGGRRHEQPAFGEEGLVGRVDCWHRGGLGTAATARSGLVMIDCRPASTLTMEHDGLTCML